MASKVEELLEKLLSADKTPLYCSQGECDYAKGKHIPTRAELEELVAEGVAEGAEVGVSAARRQLRAASASVTKQEGTRSINGVRHYLIPVRAFVVPIASVLAPTKAQS